MINLTSNTLLLDIETSGLKRQIDIIISIGIISFSNNKPVLKHWFLENKEDEKSLLESFLHFLKDYKIIYSYYGKSFDYPFLLSRMKVHNLDTKDFFKLKLIDTKEALKHFETQRKEMEKRLHFHRQSTIKSKEVIKLYDTFCTSKEPIYRTLILKHQKDELYSLLAFWELYQTLMHCDQALSCFQTQTPTQLEVTLTFSDVFTHTFTGNAFNWHFAYEEGSPTLTITMPLITESLKQYLQPVKDYYYIESQNQVIHKSLAQFIPASLKRRAAKEECAVHKSSTYLKIYSTYKLAAPICYDAHKGMYIDVKDLTLEILAHQIFSLFFQRLSSK